MSRLSAASSEEVQLVEKSGQPDGSILFVFGSAAEAKAAKQEADKQDTAKNKASAEAQVKPAASSQPASKESSASSAQSSSNGVAQQSPAGSNGKVDYESLKVLDLRHLCREHNITGFATKTKAELIELLQNEVGSNGVAQKSSPASSQPKDDIDYESLKVIDLRHLCRERNITGFSQMVKAELIEVLEKSENG